VDTTEPGSGLQMNREWVQSISALIYEEEGDYFIDRLHRMWVKEQPRNDIDVLKHDLWEHFQ
jgi:hypothetical protein